MTKGALFSIVRRSENHVLRHLTVLRKREGVISEKISTELQCNAMEELEKQPFEEEKDSHLARSEFLHHDLINILKQVNGAAGWHELATSLGGNIVNHETVRTYIRRIYEKLHARSAAEAVAKYMSK